MIIEKKLYDLDDITIIPAPQSVIRHRGEINPYYNIDGKDYLPIFVSPMECVINKENFDIYEKNNVIPILPRTEVLEDRLLYSISNKWAAYGLEEFENNFCADENVKLYSGKRLRVLIDNANGHMQQLPESIKKSKELAKENGYKIEIMAGNVANPDTYRILAEAGADYCRCSVGNGGCCVTASNTASYMPIASLIDGCAKLKEEYNLKCAIIADGGNSSYNRAIKALALGADYLMIGSIFGSCFESASEFTSASFSEIDTINGFNNLANLNSYRFNTSMDEKTKKGIIGTYKPTKAIWGMSTKRAQVSISIAQGKEMKDIKLKTSEGIEKIVPVKNTLHQWIENFTDYLRSSMSYCNSRNLNEYIGMVTVYLMTEAAKNAINK